MMCMALQRPPACILVLRNDPPDRTVLSYRYGRGGRIDGLISWTLYSIGRKRKGMYARYPASLLSSTGQMMYITSLYLVLLTPNKFVPCILTNLALWRYRDMIDAVYTYIRHRTHSTYSSCCFSSIRRLALHAPFFTCCPFVYALTNCKNIVLLEVLKRQSRFRLIRCMYIAMDLMNRAAFTIVYVGLN